MALPARGLLGQDVALERVVALHLARGRDLESLHRASAALELQLLLGLSHDSSLSARAGGGSFLPAFSLPALPSFPSLPVLPAFAAFAAFAFGFAGAASFLGDRIWT